MSEDEALGRGWQGLSLRGMRLPIGVPGFARVQKLQALCSHSLIFC
jgi:hypothetical protein